MSKRYSLKSSDILLKKRESSYKYKDKARRYSKIYYSFNKEKVDAYHEARLLILSKKINHLLGECKRRANKFNLSFDLDNNFLNDLYAIQKAKCAITNIDFDLLKVPEFRIRPWAPSIDRINSSLGYTKDNVRFVCVVVNLSLNQFGLSIFDKMCKAYCKIS